jgi:organic hydroperoxide reductase OsmC/OhrA
VLSSDATGEVELDGKVLIIRRIHVTYHLKVDSTKRETAERVLGFHAENCPVARTLRGCIDISTALEMTDTSAP